MLTATHNPLRDDVEPPRRLEFEGTLDRLELAARGVLRGLLFPSVPFCSNSITESVNYIDQPLNLWGAHGGAVHDAIHIDGSEGRSRIE